MMHAIVAEFAESDVLVQACRSLRATGYRRLDAVTPHVVPELDEVLGIRRTLLRWWVLGTGLAGVGAAYLIIWYTNARDYPYLSGGRPFDSLPTDVPIMFETAVLFAGVTAFVAALVASRLPRVHSPEIEIPGFERTSVDRFWVVIRYPDPAWTQDLPDRLRALGAERVQIVGEVP